MNEYTRKSFLAPTAYNLVDDDDDEDAGPPPPKPIPPVSAST